MAIEGFGMSFSYLGLLEHYWLASLLFVVLLSGCMLGCLELGRWMALRIPDEDFHKKLLDSVRQLDTTVCGLMGLLIAFSFYSAATRFYEREHAIMHNVNAIEKSYRQMNFLPPPLRMELQRDLRAYTDCRLQVAGQMFDSAALQQAIHCEALQYALMDRTMALMARPDDRAAVPLSYALNEMAATWTAQKAAVQRHLHPAIYLLLVEVALMASILIGYQGRSAPRSWLHRGCFSLVIMSALYVIIDMEFPRLGLIRITAPEQLLRQLLDHMQ
jgi:hypothetical protein